MRRLRADHPLVINAARERARILQSLGREVDAKTARIAKGTSVPGPRNEREAPQDRTVDIEFGGADSPKRAHGGISSVKSLDESGEVRISFVDPDEVPAEAGPRPERDRDDSRSRRGPRFDEPER